jgi:hypothetical protein
VLLAEDLLLLLTDDTSGRLPAHQSVVDVLLAGANLIELTLMGRVDIPHVGKPVRFIRFDRADRKMVDRLIVRDPSPTGDEVLDTALQSDTARQGERIHMVIRQLSKEQPHWTLYNRLASRGMVRYEQRKMLGGVKDVHRWPVQESAYGMELRRRVFQSLVQPLPPDTRSAMLIALLLTISPATQIVGVSHWDETARDIEARGREIASSDWAPEPGRKSIHAIWNAIGQEAARASGSTLAARASRAAQMGWS